MQSECCPFGATVPAPRANCHPGRYFTILRETDEKELRSHGHSNSGGGAATGYASGPAAVALPVPSPAASASGLAAEPAGPSTTEWLKSKVRPSKEKKQQTTAGYADLATGFVEGQLALPFFWRIRPFLYFLFAIL